MSPALGWAASATASAAAVAANPEVTAVPTTPLLLASKAAPQRAPLIVP